MKSWRALILSLFLLFFIGEAGAQGKTLVPGIQLTLIPSSGQEPRFWLEAFYTLPDGMHQSLQERFFGITFPEGSLPLGWSSGPVVYPPTDKKIADIPSYEKSVRIKVPLFANKETPVPPIFQVRVLWQLCYEDGVCLIPGSKVFDVETGGPNSQGPDLGSLALILFFALLGGMILNLMPCVLPVLSIKVLSLLKQAGEDRSARWAHAWASAAGILSSLIILALILIGLQASGMSVGWGVQFQNPWYVVGLLTLVLVFALSLFDVFVLEGPRLTKGRSKGLAGSFFSGLLTVVLATPCTAPFLGTALGFAFTASWWVILLVFTFIGIGLALPFFLITVIPGALERLPKPGRWMDLLKGLMAFALVGTGIWLLTVLQKQLSSPAFSGVLWFTGSLVLISWLFGVVQRSGLGTIKKNLSRLGILCLLGLSMGFFLPFNSPGTTTASGESEQLPPGWTGFSDEKVADLLAEGTPVFVDFTAEWCLTCKINEAGALSDPAVLKAFAEKKVALVRGDYTNADPTISRWLTKYKRAGVPFYALLVPNKDPELYPEILTSEMLIGSLKGL